MSQTPDQPVAGTLPSDGPEHRYTAVLAERIEGRWQRWWAERGTFVQPNPGEVGFDASRPKFYCLDMFPYPSGAGLHVGHPEGYTATDILCRYKRAKGFNVLHPMGWDAFGLPAEQYAIQTGVHPAVTTKGAIENFRRQLQRFGFCYDWSREVGTIDPGYYKWTQWVFIQLYEAWFDHEQQRARPIAELVEEFASGKRVVEYNPRGEVSIGVAFPGLNVIARNNWNAIEAWVKRRILSTYRLAYQTLTTVNWCPKLGTVLANDEVIDGRSERGGHPVLRKPMRQWMLRITHYADRLLGQLDSLAWPESTKTMQREWIGRSEGAEIEFGLGVDGVLDLGTPTLRVGIPDPTRSVGVPDPTRSVGVPIHEEAAEGRVGRHPTLSGSEIDGIAARPDEASHPTGFVACDPYPPGGVGLSGDAARSERNLPHITMPGATYFVSWRCQDGLVLSERERGVVLDSLVHFDGERGRVFAAVVMPDHVHWIVRPGEGFELGKLVESVKHFAAQEINKMRGSKGRLWEPEALDHIVRDENSFGKYVAYVVRNPVEGGLVDRASDYGALFVHADVRSRVPHAERGGTQRQGAQRQGTRRWGTQGRGLTVFTTRPDTLFGATYMVVAPEHELVGRVLAAPGPRTDVGKVSAYVQAARNKSDVDRQEAKTKTGVDLGIDAVNPATGGAIPVWVADYVLMGYGTGAIMAVPGHDERDNEFAAAMGLPVVEVVRPPAEFKGKPGVCFSGSGTAINSSGPEVSIDGLPTAEAKGKIIAWLEGSGRGVRKVNYRLRDWTFSRQRYWGEPIPIVFDEHGDHYPVSASHLPVVLPELEDYAPAESDDAQPLLAKAKAWMNTTAGAAGIEGVDPALDHPSSPVTREANTMPGSAGSSWYFLRYCDPKNTSAFIDPKIDAYWMGRSALRADPPLANPSSGLPSDDPWSSKTPGILRAEGFLPRDPYPPGQYGAVRDLEVHHRNLPHYTLPGATYFVTWRCKQQRMLSDSDRSLVLDALLHFDGKRLETFAACVMPDHVHWIVRPYEGETLAGLVSSVKRFSARAVNNLQSDEGSLWQEDRFDHVVRDERWFTEFVEYVVGNPVAQKLVESPGEYAWTFVSPAVVSGDGRAYGRGRARGRLGEPTYTDGGRLGEPTCPGGKTVGSESRPTQGGVDFYIGGSEHTVGHLLYARFWQNALCDLGHVSCREPFRRLFHQGMITSFAYQRGDKSLVPVDEVDEGPEGVFVERATGKVVEQIVAKMSKSLKNVINPDEIIAGYGADTFRLYEMYMGPLEASKPWNTKDIIGPFRFLQRLWRNVIDEQSGAVVLAGDAAPAELTRLVHRTIAGVTQDIENISLHTAIAKLIELNNAITKAAAVGPVPKSIIEPMLVLLAPFCPHICEELWSRLGHEKTIADAPWPTHDPAMLVEETVEIPVQVQGKLRGKVLVPAGSDAKTIEQIALADAKVQGALEGKPIKRVIVVPGKLVNIVTG